MTNRVSQEIDMIVRVLWAKSRSNRGLQFQLSILTGFFDPKSENQEMNYVWVNDFLLIRESHYLDAA